MTVGIDSVLRANSLPAEHYDRYADFDACESFKQMCFRLPPVGPIQLLAHSSRGRMAFVHHRRPIDIMIYRERKITQS